MVALKGAEIDAFVARPDPKRPVVLVYGPDAGLVRERVSALIRASVDDPADPFSLVQLSGDDLAADPARLADEATTFPLFGSRRAIWIKAGGKNFASAVESLSTVTLTDCRVILEAGDLKRNAPLRVLCERAKSAVSLPCYRDGDREIDRLIDDEMKRARMAITPPARALLLSLLGADRQASRRELEKLTLYALGTTEIDVDDVIAVTADAAGLALDDLIDATFAGNVAGVDVQFVKARAAGTAANTVLLAALRQVSQLHQLRLSIDGGASFSEALERSFFARNFRRRRLVEAALRTWTTERLRRAMGLIADAVRDVRVQGALADSIASRALLGIARAGRTGQ